MRARRQNRKQPLRNIHLTINFNNFKRMRKFLFLCLLTLWCVGGQAGIFKPGDRATELKSGTYFVYNTCMVNGSSDYTGFLYSSEGAMTVNHGPKPSTFSTNDPSLFWTIEVEEESTGKCTMRNAKGLYVDNSGNLTSNKSYVYITAYAYQQKGACGADVYAESKDESTSALPSTTASENAGLWIIGNEDKSLNWTTQGGTKFISYSAGQPMALYPAKTPEYNITKIGDLSAPETLEIGSYVMLYNNATSKYVAEGYSSVPVTIDNIHYTQLLLSNGCSTGKSIYNPYIFKVGGSTGAYTFQNVLTGDYIQPLEESAACYAGSSAETFSIAVNDGTITIKGSNGQCFDQQESSYVVGWSGGGANSQYKIATVEMTTEDMDVVEVLYNGVYENNIKCIRQDIVSPTTEYTYVVPSVTGYNTSATSSGSELVTTSKTVEYTYTKDETVTEGLPFTTSALTDAGKFSSSTHWYKIQLRDNGKYAKYASDTSIPTSTSNSSNDFACMFMVSGNTFSGYKIQNLAAGADKYLTVNSSNGSCSFTTTGTTFDYIKSSKNYNLFKARETSNAYLHDFTNSLGTWRSDAATTDGASNVVFCEVTDLTGTVIFEGSGYESTDALVYNNTDYTNGATTMPWYQCYTTEGVTVKDNKPALVNSSIAKSGIVVTFPFKATTISDGKFAADTKWYNLTIRGNENCIYDIYDKTNCNITSTAQKLNYGSMYCFVKDENVANGYKMYNRAAGAGVSFYNSGKNNEIGKFTTEGSTLILKTNGTSGFVFQINGVDNAHVNDVYYQLGVWNDGRSATDDGSTFKFEEVSTSDLETAASMPQPGKFYTIQEASESRYLSSELSATETSRLAMSTSVSEANKIFYFTGTHLLGFSNGRFVGMGSNNMLTQAEVGNSGTTFYFRKQDNAYNVIFNYTRALNGVVGDYADAADSGQTGTGYQFNVVEVTDLPLTIGSNGWSTFSCPVAVAVPDGVTAYYAPSDPSNDKLVLSDLDTKTIPANTGVIINGTTGNTVKFSTSTTDGEATVANNKLVSNVVATSLTGAASDGKYAFATNTSTKASGFMKLLTTITLPGHKCWLQTNTSASSAQFVPIALADDPTGIEPAETTTVGDSDAPIYDLQGRKVNGTKKGGMYIQNGKVFIAM